MNKLSKYKKGIGNIIIILGIMLIAFSLYFNNQLKVSQGKMLEEYNESIQEEPIINFDENYTSEKEKKEQKHNIDRSSITDLKMIIQIPKIKVEAAVVNGTTRECLKIGPGLYEISSLPGDGDTNVLIAAHRDTYGAWFRHIDKLANGDEVILKFGGKNYNYKVEKVFIIEKNDWSVTLPQGYSALTLTSCHPLNSSKQRIVVRCRLDNVVDE